MGRFPFGSRPQGPLVGRPPIAAPDIGPDNLRPSQPDQLGSDLGVAIRPPGATTTPAGAVPVDVSGDLDLAPGTNGILVTIQTPDSLRFRIAGIGFGAEDETALRFLTWSILLFGDPAPSGYNAQLAAIGSLRQLAEVFLLVGSSVPVTIQAQISPAAVVTYRYICRVRGWFYAEKGNG
jgi:hypothetical protein